MRVLRFVVRFVLLLSAGSGTLFAGGPILVGGPAVGNRPAFGKDGKPFVWNAARMPIAYRVEDGPMAVAPNGGVILSNSAGLTRVQGMFDTWHNVPTAAISYAYAGPLLPAGSYKSGDLNTVLQYNDVIGSCASGAQSPIIFDADGGILRGLGLPPEIIGFSLLCKIDTVNGHISSAAVLLNGEFQDGVDSPNASPPNYEFSTNQFNEAITHEIGHFSGLDHSQINLDVLYQGVYPCDVDGLAGMPLMFPILACQARKDAGLPTLSPDDAAWISTLYPASSFDTRYGSISGAVYASDGLSAIQDVNVIARLVDDPTSLPDESRRVAVSVVSGYLFTANPGQSVTASMADPNEDNTYGDPNGSRQPQLIGYYHIAVLPGTYTVEVESVDSNFVGGSSVGPLQVPVALPGQPEFWNKDESAFDIPLQRDTIRVHAGDSVEGINIILNSTQPRFDQYEDSGELMDLPLLDPFRHRRGVEG